MRDANDEGVLPSFDDSAEARIDARIDAQKRDLGGFEVGRVLPSVQRRAVGPFVFFDHFGPATFPIGQGIDVRPHPHIGLATVTYLFEGQMLHRDNIGSRQLIQPGGINWMTAGRGIAHSERTPVDSRATGASAHGLQLWIALPKENEETAPSFHHHPESTLPDWADGGVRLRVLAGAAYGATSPVAICSPLFYVEALIPAGQRLPLPDGYAERALYVVEGQVRCGATPVPHRQMLVVSPGPQPRLVAETDARVVLIGGDALDGPRFLWWNFVSSSRDRIEQAKRDWQSGAFPKVPGDDQEFIPLP